MCLRL